MCCSRSSEPGGQRPRGGLLLPLLFLMLLAGGLPWHTATAADPCLECHGLPGFGLAERPLWIHAEGYATGVHRKLSCSDCHKGAESLPHAADLRVRCDLRCHVPDASHEAIARSEESGAHGSLGPPSCAGCHRNGAAPQRAEVRALCLGCHPAVEQARRVYPDSPGAFGFRGHAGARGVRRLPDCADCHGTHGVAAAGAARGACATPGCHPGTEASFGLLFSHRPDETAEPFGGAGGLFLVLLGAVGLVLTIHTVRS